MTPPTSSDESAENHLDAYPAILRQHQLLSFAGGAVGGSTVSLLTSDPATVKQTSFLRLLGGFHDRNALKTAGKWALLSAAVYSTMVTREDAAEFVTHRFADGRTRWQEHVSLTDLDAWLTSGAAMGSTLAWGQVKASNIRLGARALALTGGAGMGICWAVLGHRFWGYAVHGENLTRPGLKRHGQSE